MHLLLKKIIRSGIGPTRFWMATIGMGVAVLFILLAVQTWANFNQLLHGDKNENETADFLVISKKVEAANQGKKDKALFTEEEIAQLQSQPFVQKLGRLTSTGFYVNVSSYSDALPFYTDAYFEAVPDEFIDLQTKDWGWQPGSQQLPIIIPTFFLDLYNTGMAMSQQSLPQLSLEALMAIPLKITVRSGLGQQAEFVGHIAGTTDRINSILIPQAFMDYANKQYGYRSNAQPSRVVIKTPDPSNPRLVDYLKEKGYTTNTDKTRFSKVRTIVQWIVGIVGSIGLVMLLFGLLVFSLFIQLTIAGCRTDIELLQTLGTAPTQLQQFLLRQFMPANLALIAVALAILALLQWLLKAALSGQNMFISAWPSGYTLVAAALLIAVIWWVNRATIRRYIR